MPTHCSSNCCQPAPLREASIDFAGLGPRKSRRHFAMPKSLVAMVSSSIALALPISQAHAGILDNLTAPQKAAFSALSNSTVGAVLDNISAKVTNMGEIFQANANLAEGNAAITLDASTQALVNSLSKQRETLVGNLNDERLLALLDVYNLTNSVMKRQIPENISRTNIDLLNALNHVAILGRKTRFMVGYIYPTVLTHQDRGDYTITYLGIGVGSYEGNNFKTHVTMKFPGLQGTKEFAATNIAQGVTITIPHDFLDPYFANSVVQRVPTTVSSTVPQGCGFLGIFSCTKHYDFSYMETVFPNAAVTVIIEQSKTHPATDPTTDKLLKREHAHAPTYDKNGGPWSGDDPVLKPEEGYAITSISQPHCDGEGGNSDFCRFVYPDPEIWHQLTINNGSYAIFKGSNNSHQVDLYFDVHEQKIIQVRDVYPTQTAVFRSSQSQYLDLKDDATYIGLRLSPAIGNDQLVTLKPNGGQASDLVVCSSPTSLGSNIARYNCRAKDYDAF